jgi:hypothetical protein
LRLLGHGGDEAVEVTAAARGLRRAAGQTKDGRGGEKQSQHMEQSLEKNLARSRARIMPGKAARVKAQTLKRKP